jgi:hypothetical protein
MKGNYWYISNKPKIQFHNSSITTTFCDQSTYEATFWAILECDIAFGLLFVISISWTIYVYVLKKKQSQLIQASS